MITRRLFALLTPALVACATMGASCAQVAKWVGKAGDIAAMVTKWLKLLNAGVESYFADNPDDELQKKIAQAVDATEKALAIVEEIGKASGNYSRGEQDEAEANLIAAYKTAYKLVEQVPGLFAGDGDKPGTPEELELAMSADG